MTSRFAFRSYAPALLAGWLALLGCGAIASWSSAGEFDLDKLRAAFGPPDSPRIAAASHTSFKDAPDPVTALSMMPSTSNEEYYDDWISEVTLPSSMWNWQTPAGRRHASPAWSDDWSDPDTARLDFVGRGYYFNDARLEFFGTEATFGVEGLLGGLVRRTYDDWQVELVGEFYLNQPYDRNILKDDPDRRSYAANFEVDPFQISQGYASARRGDFYMALGKMVTPFGRTWFPLYTNSRHDAPFIRTESILWRETGFLVQADPGPWVMTAMLSNGGPDRDSNSSKAVIARVGLDLDWFSVGTSVKMQDGIGSEGQKTFNNHVGLDAMFRTGRWTFSGEGIYDEYGIRRPGLALQDIFWGRSLYFRDLNKAYHEAITGKGYYVNAQYDANHWSLILNHGEFYPESIGEPRHDRITRRSIVKYLYRLSDCSEIYTMFLQENPLENAYQLGRTRQGQEILFGWQCAL